MRCGMLTADLTYAVLNSAGVHIDGPTADGSGRTAHDPTCAVFDSAAAHIDGPTADGSGRTAYEANQSCLSMPKLAVYTSASRHA